MSRRSLFAAAALTLVLILTACDSGSSSGSVGGPAVKFVGNDSCPTSGATPYNNGNAPSTNGPAVGQAIAEMPHTHVSPPAQVNYMHNPPTSGCHYSLGNGTAPITPGVYNQPVDPEFWVHNLEHGYVVVLYNCPSPPGCTTDFNTLHDWFKGLSPDPQLASGCVGGSGMPVSAPYAKVLILPWTSMTPKFAMVSWDWYDPMNTSLNMTEVQNFYNNHVDQAPESGVC